MVLNTYMQKNILRITGIISIFVALLTTTADELLQYSSQGYASYAYVRDFALWRSLSGHILGVITIPLLAIGYWHVCYALKLSRVKHTLVFFCIMVYGLAIGAAAHGTFAGLIVLIQTGTTPVIGENYFLTYGGPLFVVTLLCYAIVSIWYCITVLSKPTLYPKWMAFFSPFFISLLIAIFQASNIFPALGNILAPTWLNLAHVVFFTLSTCILWRSQRTNHLINKEL